MNKIKELIKPLQEIDFTNLKKGLDKVKTALGNKFDPVEHHKRILDCGPLPLRFVEKRVLASYGL